MFEGKTIWGVKQHYERHWLQVSSGDAIFFYATKPVSGVVGYGTIISKRYDETLLWHQEIDKGHALWPFRFLIDVKFCLPSNMWQAEKVGLSPQQAVLRMGFQKIRYDVADYLVRTLRSAYRPNVPECAPRDVP